MNENNNIVKGYCFGTAEDAEIARQEENKIDYLNEREDLKEEIPPVALYTVFAHRVGDDIRVPAPRIPEKTKDNTKKRLITSMIVNAMLVAVIVVMFYIAYTSDNPNILNYENNLVNKYAQWEQELSERENAIREKERNLLIEE